MSFIYKLASLNINGIRNFTTQTLLKKLLFDEDIDILMLQEVNDENLDFLLPQFKCVSNVGEANRGTAIVYRANFGVSNIKKSPCGRILSVSCNNTKLINIYAPSGNQNKKERNKFFSEDLLYYLRNTRIPIILGGDFNCVTESIDQNSSPVNISIPLIQLCKDLNLTDIWRHLHPAVSEFSFFRNFSASRLDRFYGTPAIMKIIHQCVLLPVPFSDHSIIIMKLFTNDRLGPPRYGRGWWKLNSKLLDDDELYRTFKLKFYKLQSTQAQYNTRFDWWSSKCKPFIKRFFRSEAIAKSREFNQTYEFFNSVLHTLRNRLNTGDDCYSEYVKIKHKLLDMQEKKLSNLTFRSNDKTLARGERTSLYHLVRLKKRGESTCISSICNDQGQILSTRPEIMNECVDFFASQFSPQEINSTPTSSFLGNLPPIDPVILTSLSDEISEDEIRNVIKSASRISSPGPDG